MTPAAVTILLQGVDSVQFIEIRNEILIQQQKC